MDNIITLKCFHCGKEKDVLIDGQITFGFELYNIANKAGMLGCIDLNRGRTLIFCNDQCMNAHKTKKGSIRVRPGYI